MGHNSVEYVRVVAETMKAATRDKDLFIGDPSFVDVPTKRLISTLMLSSAARRLRSLGSTA
jgi:gamma-glutamyltranspeptidase / glutathione hydrolase